MFGLFVDFYGHGAVVVELQEAGHGIALVVLGAPEFQLIHLVQEQNASCEGIFIFNFLEGRCQPLAQRNTFPAFCRQGATVNDDGIQTNALGHLVNQVGLPLTSRGHHHGRGSRQVIR